MPETKPIFVVGKAETKAGDLDPSVIAISMQLGEYLARCEKVKLIVTGATTGYPDIVAQTVRRINPNKEVLGLSPANRPEDITITRLAPHDEDHFTVLLLPDREYSSELEALTSRISRLTLTAKENNAMLILLGGGRGTRMEFDEAMRLNIPVIIFEGSGGIADEIKANVDALGEKKALVKFIKDVEELGNVLG